MPRIFHRSAAAPRILSARVALAAVAGAAPSPAALPAEPELPEPILGPSDSVALFDGTSLEGFTERGGRYDGNARWTVENGAIVGRQGPNKAGGLLYTTDRCRNFVFTVETNIDWPFDSGIFVRMSPNGKGAQVTLDYRPTGEVGAIYADGFLHHNTEAKASWRKDDWNRFTVRCVGDDYHLTVWMNGKVITDWHMDDPAAHPGFVRDGLVGLQVGPNELERGGRRR